MKWKILFVAFFLLFASSLEMGRANYDKKILWLSEEHPLIRFENIHNYTGVGIKDGQIAIIFNRDGNVKYSFLPVRNSSYDLVIICPDEFKDLLQALKEHKEEHGVKTTVVGLSEIYDSANGRDNAEKIKYFIKDAVEEWGAKYILLVGSIQKLPMRNAVYIWKSDGKIVKFPIPTDLYYADLYRYENGKIVFSTWDTNGNGVYGEDYEEGLGEDDIIDLYPDVYLGRLACENKRVVKNTISKIINYENKAYGEEWFKKLILIGGDTFPEWGIVEGELMNEKVAEIMKNFQPYKIWASLGNLNTLEVEKALERGAGFLYYSGHGFPYGMATYLVNNRSWAFRYFTPYIMLLFNSYKLPVIFFDACLTAKVDFSSSDLREDGVPIPFNVSIPCFAWYFVRHPYGGAIATVGATRIAFTGVDEDGPHWGAGYLAYKFFESYQETNVLGEVFVSAQEKYANKNIWDSFTLQEFILLGDPSLQIGGYP